MKRQKKRNNKIATLKKRLTLCAFIMQGRNTLLNLNNAFFDVNKKLKRSARQFTDGAHSAAAQNRVSAGAECRPGPWA